MQGTKLISKDAAKKLIPESSDSIELAYNSLTKREMEILMFVMQNMSNKQISERLSIAEQTVRNCVSRIYSIFNVPDRFSLIQMLQSSWHRLQLLEVHKY